jgi:hypothetical protein
MAGCSKDQRQLHIIDTSPLEVGTRIQLATDTGMAYHVMIESSQSYFLHEHGPQTEIYLVGLTLGVRYVMFVSRLFSFQRPWGAKMALMETIPAFQCHVCTSKLKMQMQLQDQI